jgi:hypothetical protein
VIVVFAGVVARQPLAGLTWVWLQYLLGLRQLGHDVYFLEESGDWPYVYDYEAEEESEDPARGAVYLDRFLGPFGIRWAYRVGDRCFGMREDEFVQICRAADLLIAVPTCVWKWRPEYDAPPVRLCLDVDPGFTQLRAAAGDETIAEAVARCNRAFTYGPALFAGGSRVPTLGHRWQPTRPPVVLEEWPVVHDGGGRFTTLMHWGLDPSPALDGELWRQKDVEFERIVDLPQRTGHALEVATGDAPVERLRAHGWEVVSSAGPSRDPDSYRRYVQAARGELSVAKNGYVRSRSGWISDRTVCFLASGKPALVQETGLSDAYPTGEGLLTFMDVDSALAGLEHIEADYQRHCEAARRVAEQEFDSTLVLTHLLAEAGL